MGGTTFVQQHLTTCEICSECLAVEYEGSHGRLTSTTTRVRLFSCPACRHENPVIVPLSAGPFVVKVVPGPVLVRRVRPSGPRRLWLAGVADTQPTTVR